MDAELKETLSSIKEQFKLSTSHVTTQVHNNYTNLSNSIDDLIIIVSS